MIPDDIDVVEVLLEGYTYDMDIDEKGYKHFTNKRWEERWVKAEIWKRAKNGSVYADTQDYNDSPYPIKRWYKKGKWREIK